MWTIRKTPARLEKVQIIAAALREDARNISAVFDYCINMAVISMPQIPATIMPPREITPQPRTPEQRELMADIAADIAARVYTGTQPTPEERVQLYETLNEPPAWYTDMDRAELIAAVTAALTSQ